MSVSECVRVFPESVAWHVRAQIKERSRRLDRTIFKWPPIELCAYERGEDHAKWIVLVSW